MKLAWSRPRAFCVFVGLAAVAAAPAFVGTAIAADDKSTIGAVMDLVGVTSDTEAAKIDYSERPKLVLPPSKGAGAPLPAPRERAPRPENWPTDAAGHGRNAERFSRVPAAGKPTEAAATADEPGFFSQMTGATPTKPKVDASEPSRRLLSEPPSGYRQPTKDLSQVKDIDAKSSSSWWNPTTWGGDKNADAAAPAAAAAAKPKSTAAAASPSSESNGGLLSGMNSMMPSFVRGSDKE